MRESMRPWDRGLKRIGMGGRPPGWLSLTFMVTDPVGGSLPFARGQGYVWSLA